LKMGKFEGDLDSVGHSGIAGYLCLQFTLTGIYVWMTDDRV
jgi:hypothetical protein